MNLHNSQKPIKDTLQRNTQKGGNRNTLNLIFFLLMLIILWLLPDVFGSEYLYFLWFLSASVISVYLMIKYKSLKKQDAVIAVLLGGIAALSNVFWGITAIFAFLGGQSVFRKSVNHIKMIKSSSKKDISATILIAAAVGAVFGTINILVIGMGMKADPGFDLPFLFLAFRAGVTEEIIFRFLLFAICVDLTKDKTLSRGENFLCYFIMCFPHALSHVSLSNFNIIMVFGGLIFNILFSLLQRKRDLSSAMGSHFIIDLMRFYVFRT